MARAVEPAVGILGSGGVGGRLSTHADKSVVASTVATPYGSVDLISGTIDGGRFVASAKSQAAPFPPHNLPYRATLMALHKAGADRLLSTSVGTAVHESVRLGDCLVPDDYIDLTGRAVSFYDGGLEGTHHADMDEPFCARLSREFVSAARSFGLRVRAGGTTATLAGPHHPTPAEGARLAELGAMVANFSAATEAKLARELGMCFVAGVVAVRTLAPAKGWRRAPEKENTEEESEAALLRHFAAGRTVVPAPASRPAATRRGALPRITSKAAKELEALKATLRDLDERLEEAAAAFVPHAASFPPCTRCPSGAGPPKD